MRSFLFAAMMTAASSVFAQSVKVEYYDGTPAVDLEIARRVEKSTKSPVKGCAGWVVSENVKPLRRPYNGEANASGKRGGPEESGAEGFEYFERVTVLDSEELAKSQEGVFHLVAHGEWATAGLKILGWVPDDRLLTKTDCLTDPASGVQLKGLVVNSRRYVTESKHFDLAKILRAPEQSAKELDPFRFFNFYFVFKDTDPDHEDLGYVLLGEQPRFNPKNAVSSGREELIQKSGIQGWVHKSRVCLWRTREALMWNDQEPDREPVLAYADQDRAIKNAKADSRDALESFDNGAPPKWEADRMRYPIIALRDSSGKPQLNLTRSGNVLWKIGLIGDVEDENGNIVIAAGRMQKMQKELAELREQLQQTEILFVVDDTATMRQWFKPARDAILQIVEKARESDRSVKAGISFYHDIPENERADPVNLAKAVQTMRLADPRTDRFKEMMAKIENKNEENGYDKREQLYQGLLLSLEDPNSGFTPSGPRKMVVLIGDDGNHELGDAEQKVIERIVDRLAPKVVRDKDGKFVTVGRTPVEFFALQVAPVDDGHRQAFERQATAIGKKLDERLRSNAGEAGWKDQRRYFRVSNASQLLDTIDQRYTELAHRAAALDDDLRRLQAGQFTEQDIAGEPIASGKGQTRFRDPELLQLLRSRNLSLNDFAQGVQVFDYHFVWENGKRTSNGKMVTQVRRQLLLSQGNLDDLISLLKKYFGEGEKPPSTTDLATQIQNAQLGEEAKRRIEAPQSFCGGPAAPSPHVDSIQDFLPSLGGGVGFQRGLLKRTVDQLKKGALAEDPQQSQEIKKRWRLLEDVRNRNNYEYGKDFPNDEVKLKRGKMIGNPGSHQRDFPRGVGSFFWYWIDFEDEWP